MGAWKDKEDLSSDDSESYDSESDERDSDIEVEAVGSDGGASVTQEESNHTTLEVVIPHPNQDEDDPNRSPTPWASIKAKQKIIAELLDSLPAIHCLIGKYDTDNIKEVNFENIRENMPTTSTIQTTSEQM